MLTALRCLIDHYGTKFFYHLNHSPPFLLLHKGFFLSLIDPIPSQNTISNQPTNPSTQNNKPNQKCQKQLLRHNTSPWFLATGTSLSCVGLRRVLVGRLLRCWMFGVCSFFLVLFVLFLFELCSECGCFFFLLCGNGKFKLWGDGV